MKIVRVAVRNFLGIRDFEAKLDPGINVVRGENGSGKSSLLDAMLKCLGGARAGRGEGPWVINRPNGKDPADAAEILVELDGSLQVRRRITARGTDLAITRNVNGIETELRSPQAWLDSIVGAYSLDPVGFYKASGAERRKLLLSVVPALLTREDVATILQAHLQEAGIPDEEIAAAVAPHQKIGLEELRSIEGAVMASRQGAWAKKEHHEEAEKAEAAKLPAGYDHQKLSPDFQEIMARLDVANATTANVTAARHSLAGIVSERDRASQDVGRVADDGARNVQRVKDEVSRLESQIAALQAKLEQTRTLVAAEQEAADRASENARGELVAIEFRVTDAQEKLNAATAAAIDPAPIKEEAARYQQAKAWRGAFDEATRHGHERAANAARVRAYDSAIQDGLRVEAPGLLWSRLEETPLKGLNIGMEGDRITVGGTDIDNLSTSEQIRVALAIARATAVPGPNGLKTIGMDQFEALDDKTRAAFYEQAKDDGYQYVVLEVAEGGLRVESGATT